MLKSIAGHIAVGVGAFLLKMLWSFRIIPLHNFPILKMSSLLITFEMEMGGKR